MSKYLTSNNTVAQDPTKHVHKGHSAAYFGHFLNLKLLDHLEGEVFFVIISLNHES